MPKFGEQIPDENVRDAEQEKEMFWLFRSSQSRKAVGKVSSSVHSLAPETEHLQEKNALWGWMH